MNTIVIEILRNGQAVNQLLQKQANYIALCGGEPAKDFMINCDQPDFDEHVKLLRYNNTDEDSRQQGIKFFQELISDVIDQIYPAQIAQNLENDILHLRLVTTPKEIAQLPFEMALTPVNLQVQSPPKPFFLNPERITTFTREVRHVSFSHYNWPFKPRILFAWAQPKNEVPYQQHFSAFAKILRPWAIPLKTSDEPIPDIGSLITQLKNATIEAIKDEIAKAFEEKKPYTHVHILAHGSKNTDPAGEQFLLVLNSSDKAQKAFYARGSDIASALTVERNGDFFSPQVVSLIACDSGNMGSPVHPAGSLAHYLHQSGIPAVFASQFPLTQDGSVKLVESLYTQLLQSSDPRLALYCTRVALDATKVHDWASLVAYARFPEDIDEQMKDTRLKIMLEFMKTSNALADHVMERMNTIRKEKLENFFNEVMDRLNSAINDLTGLVETVENKKTDKHRYAEHYGLIGSAYKRKAEHLFREAVFKNDTTPNAFDAAAEALKNARYWYYKAYYQYLNSHWTGAQFLSLELVLTGSLESEEKKDMWTVCKIMACRDEQIAGNDESRAWAFGTLAELYLLKPFTVPAEQQETEKISALGIATTYLDKLNVLQNQAFPKESTARQFERYINWWPKMITSETVKQLSAIAAILCKQLTETENTLR